MQIHVHTFGRVKELFKDKFKLELSEKTSVKGLIEKLAALNMQSKAVLGTCRYAANNTVVDHKHILKDQDNIFVLPPSSGG